MRIYLHDEIKCKFEKLKTVKFIHKLNSFEKKIESWNFFIIKIKASKIRKKTMDDTSTLLTDQSNKAKNHSIPLDHLDFKYVEKCSDIKELEKIYKVLK